MEQARQSTPHPQIEREWSAHLDKFVSPLTDALNWQVQFAAIYMVLLDTQFLKGRTSVLLSTILFLGNLAFLVITGRSSLNDVRVNKAKEAKLDALHAQLVIDKHEDAQKFLLAWTRLVEAGALGDDAALLEALRQLALTSALASGKQPTPKQAETVVDVDALLDEADDVSLGFHALLRELVRSEDGDYLQGPNKTRARAIEKIQGDYKGDHTKLVDVVRASAIFNR